MIQNLTQFLNGIPFFSSVWFGVIAMVIVGGSFPPVFRNEAPQNNKHSFWRMDNVIKHLLLRGHLEHDSLFDS